MPQLKTTRARDPEQHDVPRQSRVPEGGCRCAQASTESAVRARLLLRKMSGDARADARTRRTPDRHKTAEIRRPVLLTTMQWTFTASRTAFCKALDARVRIAEVVLAIDPGLPSESEADDRRAAAHGVAIEVILDAFWGEPAFLCRCKGDHE